MEQDLNADVPVVESYLAQGTSLLEVKADQLLPFTEDGNDTQQPLQGLEVWVRHHNNNYLLYEDTTGVYRYQSPGFRVDTGSYLLEFDYKGKPIKATTTVPSKPTNYNSSTTTLSVERIASGSFGFSFDSFDPVELTWDNPDNGYYFMKLEYLEATQDYINGNMEDTGREFENTLVSDPFIGNAYSYDQRNIVFFGTYRIVLFRINQEYANMFESISQNSQNLTSPLTNIENGWGIFTGFNSDTLYLEVDEL